MTPGGVLEIYCCKSFNSPVSSTSWIFLPIASPMPFMEVTLAMGISPMGVGSFSRVKAAMEYDFVLKEFSPWMSISLERRLNRSAI